MLFAWFFSLLIAGQEYPILVGPYETRAECVAVNEWLERRGYESESCERMPIEQDAIYIVVGYIL